MNVEKLLMEITTANTQDGIDERVQEMKPEYVDGGWEKEFDSLDEAYDETGRGEAESAILDEIINETRVEAINDDDYIKLYDKLKTHYNFSTE